MTTPEDILSFWFGTLDEEGAAAPEISKRWFEKDRAFDRALRERFEPDVHAALQGQRDDWASSPRSALALILLLDQLTRNIYRDTPKAFAGDERALGVSHDAVERGDDRALSTLERIFLYMPYQHSEELDVQERGVELFERAAREAPASVRQMAEVSADFARQHRDIIARFGRFPHRNRILGRTSTEEEIEFLKQPGSSF